MGCKSQVICKIMPRGGITQYKHLLWSDYQIIHSVAMTLQADNFMAAVTICSDFGAQENKISYCFHCFPIYLP